MQDVVNIWMDWEQERSLIGEQTGTDCTMCIDLHNQVISIKAFLTQATHQTPSITPNPFKQRHD